MYENWQLFQKDCNLNIKKRKGTQKQLISKEKNQKCFPRFFIFFFQIQHTLFCSSSHFDRINSEKKKFSFTKITKLTKIRLFFPQKGTILNKQCVFKNNIVKFEKNASFMQNGQYEPKRLQYKIKQRKVVEK